MRSSTKLQVSEMLGSGDLSNDGGREADDCIRAGLDREYPDWKNPTKTYMVPPSFPRKHCGDNGLKTEEAVYNLLQQLGEQNNKPMFVLFSVDFSEHIPGNGRKRSWVMGETDFVIIHRKHGPIFIQVKATEDGKAYKEAEEQLRKDKLVLQKYYEGLVKGKISGKKTIELFKNFPAFVAMPNCKRGAGSVCVKDNALYQEDCSSLEAFADWWQKRIASAEHPAVSQIVFEYLVMRYVGMSYLRPSLGLSLDRTDKKLIFQTKQQMEILADSFPSKLWIRGPAGSGKTYLILEKASRLAIDILEEHANKKILVVCFNLVLWKALQKQLHALVAEKTSEDVSAVLHIKTFSELVSQLADNNFLESNNDKEYAVNQALECVQRNGSPFWGYYDHIFVDEGQDLFGISWPVLLEKMHKGSVQSEHGGLEDLPQTGIFWVMYDINQYLYFAKDRCKSFTSHLKDSAPLNKVFRNTQSIFAQSEKYFKSMMPHDSPITLGHQEAGPQIEWDDSLVSRGVDEIKAAPVVVGWLKKLHSDRVKAKDICILVETQVKQTLLQDALLSQNTESQTGDSFVEISKNAVVVESVRRFKGMESMVVILYNPPFEDDPSSNTKEFLYTAISRCSCLLIVISTKQGVTALKSSVGVTEERTGARKQYFGLRNKYVVVEPSQGLEMEVDFQHPVGREVPCSQYSPPIASTDFGISGVQLSLEEVAMYEQQYEQSIKRAESIEPRPMEVDGSLLFEPGDPHIPDLRREGVFSLLSDLVSQNVQHIPHSSKVDSTVNVQVIVAHIEYEMYLKRRADCHSRKYTRDLRKLKKEIESCNDYRKPHESVTRAVGSAST